MGDLSKLAAPQVREALLLAEVAAWLHDWKKCSDEHIRVILWQQYNGSQTRQSFRRECPSFQPQSASGLPSSRFGSLFSYVSNGLIVLLQQPPINIADLVRQGRRGREDTNLSLAIWLLRKAHHAAHFEKEKRDTEIEGVQCTYAPLLSTSFGLEKYQVSGLTARLNQMGRRITTRADIAENLRSLWELSPGDTRRPINEVTLWDWSSIVAALYKAELARCVLTGQQRQPNQIAWRLLSVRTDGLGYLLSAPSIPDMLAHKKLLTDAWNRVQNLLEETYPLGLEVYRDENGSLFVVPDVAQIETSLVDTTNGKTLHQLIRETFDKGTVKDDRRLRVNGEIVPEIHADPQPWNGQPPGGLPPVGEHLRRQVALTSDPHMVADAWRSVSGQTCTVCGLRPQGPSPKAKSRGVCDVCEQRRADRSEEWIAEGLDTTIWLDEVADANGRLALLVGQFDLAHWLDGSLVRTLAVREPNDANGHTADQVAKNPSFARLRRIWETTRRFWQEVAPTGEDKDKDIAASLVGRVVGQGGPRLEIRGKYDPPRSEDTLGSYHTYELVLPRGVRLSAVWEGKKKRFITCDNLDYLAGEGQLGRPVREVLQEGTKLTVEEPVGYGARNKVWGTITLTQEAKEIPGSTYTPVIPILAEPRTFMALVPAGRALDVVREIKAKYEREMGKVRNRLPLHLGIVYAHRRTPLRAVLDAGRRMLKHKVSGSMQKWRVAQDVNKQTDPLPEKAKSLADGTQQFAEWYAVQLENREQERSLTWYVPAVMGDGSTPDKWYPYVFVETNAKPTGRTRYFQAPNPFNRDDGDRSRPGWLVHVKELKEGDVVYFTPATLDFIWLDTSARRFGIAYDEQGRRRGLPRRPYLLDDLEVLETIWETLSTCLTTTQVHALNMLIEGKREAWQPGPGDGAFRHFCRDALSNAEWRQAPWGDDRESWLDAWSDYAVRGWIADALELHHHVMKQSAER